MPESTLMALEPFTVYYSVRVEVKGFERLSDETPDEARAALVKEIRDGFKQTQYNLYWEIEDTEIREGVEN